MRALKGALPRGLPDHRTAAAIRYRQYVQALVARHGHLSADAARWAKEAGLLTLNLDDLHAEAAAARLVLSNGSGRRARDRARVTVGRLERRAARLRAALEAAERRVEVLATPRRPPSIQEALAAARRAQTGSGTT